MTLCVHWIYEDDLELQSEISKDCDHGYCHGTEDELPLLYDAGYDTSPRQRKYLTPGDTRLQE